MSGIVMSCYFFAAVRDDPAPLPSAILLLVAARCPHCYCAPNTILGVVFKSSHASVGLLPATRAKGASRTLA